MNRMNGKSSNNPFHYSQIRTTLKIRKAVLLPNLSKKSIPRFETKRKENLPSGFPKIVPKNILATSTQDTMNTRKSNFDTATLRLPLIFYENESVTLSKNITNEESPKGSHEHISRRICINEKKLTILQHSKNDHSRSRSTLSRNSSVLSNSASNNDTARTKQQMNLSKENKRKVSFANSKSPCPGSTQTEYKHEPIVSNNSTEILSDCTTSEKRKYIPIFRHSRLVWLLSDMFKSTIDFKQSLRQLRLTIDTVDYFTDIQQGLDFLRVKRNETTFLIVSSDLSQSTIPVIHNFPHIASIYLLHRNQKQFKKLIETSIKIKGVYSSIDAICEILQRDIQQHRRDSVVFSVSSMDSDSLDISLLYTRQLKEILMEMDDDEQAKSDFICFCRENVNINQLYYSQLIDEFERDYHKDNALWWYTRDCFLFEMINEAIRLQRFDSIIKTRMFIRDLQKQIELLYEKPTENFYVYRGQALSETDFEQLHIREGGLYSFNSFLSTSMNYNVARSYADSCRDNPEQDAVLFQIEVCPDVVTSTPWVSINNMSYFVMEDEVLFGMSSVFRVGKIEKMEDRLWHVQLSLTNDDEDEELTKIMNYIREETQASKGWDRLGKLFMKKGKFNTAEEVFKILIENTTNANSDVLGHRHHMMGFLQTKKCNYDHALRSYNTALEFYKKNSNSHHLEIANVYNDIGTVHMNRRNYEQALNDFHTALKIQENFVHVHKSNLAITYGNIAGAYRHLGQYSNAYNYYERTCKIQKDSPSTDSSSLAVIYSNMGEMLYNLQKYPEALKVFRRASRLLEKNPLSNKIDRAMIANSIGQIHNKTKDNSAALQYYQKAIDIAGAFNSSNAYEFSVIYSNLAQTHKTMNHFEEALQYYEKLRQISVQYPNMFSLNLAAIRDNIGLIYENMHQYDKAFNAYKAAITIERNSMCINHSQLELYQQHFNQVIPQVTFHIDK